METIQQVGRYNIKRELGRGGMATVYLAQDPHFDREVAVKVLPREFLHDPSFFERFTQEARTIARLEHQNILPVYDFGEADGIPYIVMRYMPHQSLRQRLQSAPGPGLPLQEVMDIIQQVTKALDFAHSQQVIHRDLKPGNVLLDREGNAYLSDFGIAKVIEATMTHSGTLWVGTPSYMAPEQVRAAKPTPQTDIYALGAMLFELLTGKVPFHAEDPLALAYQHVNDPVPQLNEYRSDLPAFLQEVVEKAMAKDPPGRFVNAQELANTLRNSGGPQDQLASKTQTETKTPEEDNHQEIKSQEETSAAADPYLTQSPSSIPGVEPAPVAPAAPASSELEETSEPEAAYATQAPPLEPAPEPEPENANQAPSPEPEPKPVSKQKPDKRPKKPRKPIQIPWQWVGPAGGGVLVIAFFALVYFGLLPLSGLQHSMKLLTPDSNAGDLLSIASCNSRFLNDPQITSSWSENRVRIDGRTTQYTEWSDATCIRGYLYHLAWEGDDLVEKGTTSVRWWVKNDAKWVYMLVRISKDDMRLVDGVYLDYFWDGGGDWDWQGTDGVYVNVEGNVSDIHGWDGQEWYADEEAGGKKNVRGSFSEDETYFWFEFKKELNSGDDLDWIWKPGKTYGGLTHSGYDSLLLGAWESVPTDMKQLSFSLRIAEE